VEAAARSFSDVAQWVRVASRCIRGGCARSEAAWLVPVRCHSCSFGDFQDSGNGIYEKLGPLVKETSTQQSWGGGGLQLVGLGSSATNGAQYRAGVQAHAQARAKVAVARAQVLLTSLRGVLAPGSTMFLSTDESSPMFTSTFREAGIRVVQSEDFFDDNKSAIAPILAKLSLDADGERMRKLKGPIEQLICAHGKVFVGTESSTFSSYIQRVRGYTDAPVKRILHHTRGIDDTEMRAIDADVQAWERQGGAKVFNRNDGGRAL